MTTETVTRQEMAEALKKESGRTEKAMADLAKGLLRLLGLEPQAEMGQTPWLNSSVAKGSLADLDKLSTTVYELAQERQASKAQVGRESQHPPGLCTSASCETCVPQRQKLAKAARETAMVQAGEEIDLACDYSMVPSLRDHLTTVLDVYRKAGQPGLKREQDFLISVED